MNLTAGDVSNCLDCKGLDELEKLVKESLAERKAINTAREKEGEKKKNFFSLDSFELGHVLGHGRFGKVYYAKDKKLHFEVAIKKIEKKAFLGDPKKERQVFFEPLIHQRMKHPNIITFLLQFHEKDSIYFVIDYASGGNLRDHTNKYKRRRVPEPLCAKFAFQVADALLYIHEEGYLYGDLKPENVFLDANLDVKLGDFGIAFPIGPGLMINGSLIHGGTAEYLAPELIYGLPFDLSVDRWCLGVFIFELLAGRTPFECKRLAKTRDKIDAVTYKFPDYIKEGPQNVIKGLLQKEKENRSSLLEVLLHPWILKHNTQRPHSIKSGEPWPFDHNAVRSIIESQLENISVAEGNIKTDRDLTMEYYKLHERKESWYVPYEPCSLSALELKNAINNYEEESQMEHDNEMAERQVQKVNGLQRDDFSDCSTDITIDSTESEE